jgi:hypothetical protein
VATKAAKKTSKKTGKKIAVRYIVNAKGKKTEVVLPLSVYKRMLERLEDIEDIKDFDEAMKDPDFIPWEEAERQLDELADPSRRESGFVRYRGIGSILCRF